MDATEDCTYSIADGEDPSQAIIHAVGEATDRGPLELPPLGEAFDTDSIDTLVGSSADEQGLIVRFEYAGCTVRATPSTIRVSPR